MTWLIWLELALSAVTIILAGIKLAEYGDAISYRTGLGGLFVGSLLVAGATSLPEILTTINGILQNQLNLTAGNLFGSCMFNMLLLGVLDLLFYQKRLLRRVALNHALTASLGILLLGLAALFIVAKINLTIAWLGVDGLLLIVVYVVGIWLVRRNPVALPPVEPVAESEENIPTLRRAAIGFAITAALLTVAAPFLVSSSSAIAEITGLGGGFIGVILLGVVTSLPELVSGIAAVRVGAYDLAVGNLFGSNMFNMLILGLTDMFYTQGSFFTAIDPAFTIVGLLAMVLTALGLVGNLAQVERRVGFVEIDAVLLIIAYLASMWLLYTRGLH